LLLLVLLAHHLLVVLSPLWESTLHISHVLLHELHLLLLHSSLAAHLEVATTWKLLAVSLRASSHHCLVLHVGSSWSGWHACSLIWHWSLAGLSRWLVLLGHLSLSAVL
jgi:hypothetical protein